MSVTWREGTRGKMRSRFLAAQAPANIGLRHKAHKAGEELALRWLICEWPSKEEPTKYWLSNLAPDTPLKNWCVSPSCAGASSRTTAS